jgi:hypothetical protein
MLNWSTTATISTTHCISSQPLPFSRKFDTFTCSCPFYIELIGVIFYFPCWQRETSIPNIVLIAKQRKKRQKNRRTKARETNTLFIGFSESNLSSNLGTPRKR